MVSRIVYILVAVSGLYLVSVLSRMARPSDDARKVYA
jgi:uncharacterized membrane protein YuzA (DUF378 family)